MEMQKNLDSILTKLINTVTAGVNFCFKVDLHYDFQSFMEYSVPINFCIIINTEPKPTAAFLSIRTNSLGGLTPPIFLFLGRRLSVLAYFPPCVPVGISLRLVYLYLVIEVHTYKSSPYI